MKFDQEKYLKLENEYDKEKKERIRWEAKVAEIDSDLLVIFLFIIFYNNILNNSFNFSDKQENFRKNQI